MTLKVECFDHPSAFAALEPEWSALAAQLVPRLPFQTWHWSEAWWRHFAVDRPALKDNLRLYTVRDANGALRMIAPMVLTVRPARGPVRARMLHFFGADPNVTEVRGPLCLPEHGRDAYEALLRHIDAEPDTWDWLEWNGVPWGSGGERALETRGAVQWAKEVPDFVLPVGDSWEALKSSRSRNVKESLRKCYNSLKREGLTFTFRVIDSAAEMPETLERFFELHAARATRDGTIEHRDVFATERARSFLRDYATTGTARGEAKVFELLIGGTVVAARVAFVLGDTLYLYFTGYRAEFQRFSVMTTTTAEAFQWAISKGLKTVNLSPGRDVSKTRWSPDEVLFRDALVASRRRRAGWTAKAFLAARAAGEQQTGLVGRVLRLGVRGNH